jgi:hypothetical protein
MNDFGTKSQYLRKMKVEELQKLLDVAIMLKRNKANLKGYIVDGTILD